MSGYSAVYLVAAAIFFGTCAFAVASGSALPAYAMFFDAARLWRK